MEDKRSWAYWYDVINTKERNDLQFYARQMEKDDLALEIACGTGRIYLDMLKDGYNVHGLDISEKMLTKLEEKADKIGLETKELFHENVSNMELDQKYDVIYYPFNSIAHIDGDIESQLNAFKNIHTHLGENGVFAFDIYVMDFDSIAEYGELKSKEFTHNGTNYKFEMWSEMASEVEQRIKSYNRIINIDEGKIEWQAEHELSLYPKQQIELILMNTGFRNYEFYDGFTEEPIDSESNHMGIVAEK